MGLGFRRVLPCERGLTLVELLWAVALALVVIVGPLYFIVTALTQQNAASSRTAAAAQAETGLEQLVRDLRQAMSQDANGNALTVTVSNPTGMTSALSFNIPTPGSAATPESVTWTCPSTGAVGAGPCTRQLAGGPLATEIAGVTAATFAPTNASGAAMPLPATDPAYIGVTLAVQGTSQLDPSQTHAAAAIAHPIRVQTGIDLRNFS